MTGDKTHLQDGGIEGTYILGEVISRGQFSTVFKCLYKGKIERACRTYAKPSIPPFSQGRLQIALPWSIDPIDFQITVYTGDDDTIPIYVAKGSEKTCFYKQVQGKIDTDSVNLSKVNEQLEEIVRIVHPNLIHIYQGFKTPDEIHFITERVYGEELFERIVHLGHYSEQEAASLTRDIVSALVCLHQKGIVHGDIRPESLIYSREGHDGILKLRDVSFSKMSPNTHATVFIAPENGDVLTTCGDMWSLGIVLYIMLCGIEPGAGEVFTELVPGLTLPWWEDISNQAKEVIQRMLDLDPYSRLKAEEAFELSWVQGSVTRKQHLEAAVERLREFNAKAKFRVASKAVLATRKLSLPFLRRTELR